MTLPDIETEFGQVAFQCFPHILCHFGVSRTVGVNVSAPHILTLGYKYCTRTVRTHVLSDHQNISVRLSVNVSNGLHNFKKLVYAYVSL